MHIRPNQRLPRFHVPTNEQELFLAVSKASLAKQHMEAVSTYDHSIPKLSCPGGPSGSPPGPVVKCTSGQTNCTVTNAYGAFPDRSTCRVAAVTYPTNEQEFLLAVSNASLAKQHMKAVSTYGHSIPKLSCPGGPSGAGLAISTERLNKSVHVDVASSCMTVEAGITLRALLDVAGAAGRGGRQRPRRAPFTLLAGSDARGSARDRVAWELGVREGLGGA